ncbi:hypothetical protein D918_03321 [Trichuris suis]|nr:hypothetical protein D918_03321 [Trichuris suis]
MVENQFLKQERKLLSSCVLRRDVNFSLRDSVIKGRLKLCRPCLRILCKQGHPAQLLFPMIGSVSLVINVCSQAVEAPDQQVTSHYQQMTKRDN